MQKILEVEDLQVSLSGEKIIDNLSFNIEKRDSLVILGPNGAGKTTLFKALLGLIPYQGKVKWYTQKISYLPPQELVARTSLFPLTVADFFSFKEASLRETKNKLREVGLETSVIKKTLNKLSTGQFQRMIIAWSLVGDPEVLLFDEPTSGIDIGGQETIYTLLHKFWEENNLTILLVTHELNVVWEHASQVLCLNKKRLCYGKPDEVLTPQKLKELYGGGVKFYKHKH